MKYLPDNMAEHLASGATTLCWCWRLTRRDGLRLGFTDHDRDLVFDATTFEAAAGFSASELKDAIGLSVDNLSVSGALSSGRLEEAELAAGRYDDARIEVFRVNWQMPAQRLLMRSGSIGEVKRDGIAFTAEVRGLAHVLQQPRGRLFQYGCDADVGDRRCGIDVRASLNCGNGSIVEARSARALITSGLGGYAAGWFARGLLTFTSGAAAGQAIEVKSHALAGGEVVIELWAPARLPLTPGQTFTVTAGCDKHLATCIAKFANAVNYRGFPHMPGNDFVTRRAGS